MIKKNILIKNKKMMELPKSGKRGKSKQLGVEGWLGEIS